ncbi:ASKHA domain-containing protein [Myxococcota bacterium]|nr:ASKHA domain-containing protein [Myxococcota bacterium]
MIHLNWSKAGHHRLTTMRPGETVLDALSTFEPLLGVAAECDGNGACGACRVRVEAGVVPPPTDAERANLRDDELAHGYRLACQLRPTSDLELEVPDDASARTWRVIEGLVEPSVRGAGIGAAVDLGSTRVRVSVWSLDRGERLAAVAGPNPQARHGIDVLTRLAAARDPARADVLSTLAKSAIAEGLTRAMAYAGIQDARIDQLVVVGNTAMLALLTRRGSDALLDPARWSDVIDCAPAPDERWPTSWRLADGVTPQLIAPLAGFVGSDLIAAALSSGLLTRPRGTVLLDFGTNTELALWDGARAWVTAAAGGPAFEGWGLSCGMPAIDGAIHHVRADGDRLSLSVIGACAPRGLCATGFVELVAALRAHGRIDALGRFTGSPRPRVITFSDEQPALTLRPQDVDLLQRAKAAVAAGVESLSAASGVSMDEVSEVVVTGTLGEQLDVHAAQALGLLPRATIRVEARRELALLGAERLLDDGVRADHAALRACARHVSLSEAEGYDDRFVTRLRLEPM